MASTPNHAIHSGIIAYGVLKLLWIIIGAIAPVIAFFLAPVAAIIATALVTLAAVAGAQPDIVGDLEPETDNEPKRWNWYRAMHTEVAVWALKHWYYGFTLFLVLHVWLDQFFHDPETGQWTTRGYIIEGVLWAVIIASLIIIWR